MVECGVADRPVSLDRCRWTPLNWAVLLREGTKVVVKSDVKESVSPRFGY